MSEDQYLQRWLRMTVVLAADLEEERKRRGYRRFNDFLLHLIDMGYRESMKMRATPVTPGREESAKDD